MLAQFFPPDIGGEERHVLNLAEILARRGHQVAVATQLLPGTPSFEVLTSGVAVHRFVSTAMRHNPFYADAARPHHLPVPDPSLTAQLRQLVRRIEPDVVHAHNWIVNSAIAIRGSGFGRRRFSLVLTLHDYSHVCATKRLMHAGTPCAGPRPARCLSCSVAHYGLAVGTGTAAALPLMRRWRVAAIDHIVAVSTEVAERNGLAATATPFSVIPNFVPDELLLATDGPVETAEAQPYAFFAGDLRADKGVVTLCAAYATLPHNRPTLLMVGRRYADTPAEPPAGVRIESAWPHERIMEGFRGCQFAVVPSLFPDPCPTTVLEAMASGKPVIASRTGGIVDQVRDGVSGILVPPGDITALAAAMGALAADAALRDRLGRAARERARAFTASSVAASLEEVYDAVRANRQEAGRV